MISNTLRPTFTTLSYFHCNHFIFVAAIKKASANNVCLDLCDWSMLHLAGWLDAAAKVGASRTTAQSGKQIKKCQYSPFSHVCLWGGKVGSEWLRGRMLKCPTERPAHLDFPGAPDGLCNYVGMCGSQGRPTATSSTHSELKAGKNRRVSLT